MKVFALATVDMGDRIFKTVNTLGKMSHHA